MENFQNDLDQKTFQELVFKAIKNRKSEWLVDRQQIRSIDGKLFFSSIKYLFLRR